MHLHESLAEAALRSEPVSTFPWAPWIAIWGTVAAAYLRGTVEYPFTATSFLYLLLFVAGVVSQAIPGKKLCRAVAFMASVAVVALAGIVGQIVFLVLGDDGVPTTASNFSVYGLLGFDCRSSWKPLIFDVGIFVVVVAATVPLLIFRGASGERSLLKMGYLLSVQCSSINGFGVVAVLSLGLATVAFPCALSFINLVLLLVALFHWNCVFPKKFTDLHQRLKNHHQLNDKHSLSIDERESDFVGAHHESGGERMSPAELALQKQREHSRPQTYFMAPGHVFSLVVSLYNLVLLIVLYGYVRMQLQHVEGSCGGCVFQPVVRYV